MAYILIADGGCKGPLHNRRGYGSYIIMETPGSIDEGTFLRHGAFADMIGPSTNNVAEYTALIQGLEDLVEMLPDPEEHIITIAMDSQLVLNQVTGFWRVKEPHLMPLHEQAVNLLSKFGEVRTVWMPRDIMVSYLGH